MLTRSIDAAYASMHSCQERVPYLRDRFAVGSAERAVLEDVLAALKRADEVLLDRYAKAPRC